MSFAADVLAAVRGTLKTTADLRDPQTMLDNLVFVHQLIVASEPLLELAIQRARKLHPAGEPMRKEVHGFSLDLLRYFRSHLEEERGHANWLDDDLASADVSVQACALQLDAVQMAGMQYYLVRHAHPAALLGYMAVLECSPMPLAQVEHLENLHGTKLLRTLRYHAEHDIDHGADVCAMLDKVPAHLQELVKNNALITAQHLNRAAQRFGKG
jgi:hypothetical protein